MINKIKSKGKRVKVVIAVTFVGIAISAVFLARIYTNAFEQKKVPHAKPLADGSLKIIDYKTIKAPENIP